MSSPHPPLREAGTLRARAAGVVVVLLALLLAIPAQTASAYWTSGGAGSATGTTGSIAAPVAVMVPESGLGEVPVAWEPGVGGVAPDGYYVTRHTTTPPTSAPACASTPSALLETTSCTDKGVPDGTYTYLVTAVFRSWTARSVASEPVSVVNATHLVFLEPEPTDVTTGQPISPAVRVALRTAHDQPFARSGVAVTLAIGTNPAAGTLAGITAVNTDADGVATFPGLSINQAGVGYTLTATSPGLDADTSAAFNVTPPPVLGAAGSYSVLAYTAVVNTGATTISGDVGVSPGSAVSGFPPGVIGGDLHVNDADAALAQEARVTAYNELAALDDDATVSGDLNGLTITPGVYRSAAALALTGTLTLDAQDDPDAVFVFQVGAAFDTAAASRVTLVNGAEAANVYWVVTGAAGTGANSFFSGTILTPEAITIGAGTVLIGRALSGGTVTMAANTIRFTDALPPTMTIDGGPTAVSKDVTPTITGTTNAPPSSPVTVTIEGQPPTPGQLLTTTVGPDGTWSITAATLPAGTYSIVAKVRAPNGNGATATQALTIEVNPAPVSLGTASTYSVLAATGVVNTGATVLSGDLGVSPSTVITGFGGGPLEGTVEPGTIHAGDAAAAQASADLAAARGDASADELREHTKIIGDLGGRIFHAGVHHSDGALALTGTVTLDAEGDPDAVFIFRTDAAFDTAASSTVLLTNGARASNVFWVVAGAAGTGANSDLSGSILAEGAITLGAGTELEGRALSLGTVTLATNTLTGVAPAPVIP